MMDQWKFSRNLLKLKYLKKVNTTIFVGIDEGYRIKTVYVPKLEN